MAASLGCASKTPAAAKTTGTKYIYLPPDTSSSISRRVAVNPDGTVSGSPSEVQTANPAALTDVQRKGSVSRGTGN
ncbi:MAG: hypothetical protein EXS35_11945 [Pedosphaera sp.]|nr:hypothetical protein [Pedosphaera sp.]